jgi:hypothetical protein
LRHFILELPSVYQDRLGTNIGKALKKETRFLTGVSLGGKSLAKDVAFSLGSPWAEVPAKQETFDFTDTGAKSLFLGVV